MSDDQDDELKPTETGYKLTQPPKTLDEYAQLDAEDESLARWKASLGIVPGAPAGPAVGPKVTVLSMELVSLTLPPDKPLVMDLQNPKSYKDTPVNIKEGVEFHVRIKFKVNHSIISGVRYIQVTKKSHITVDKTERMLGSYGPNTEPYVKNFDPDMSPSGMMVRLGTYNVRSRVIDDDGAIYLDWEWQFKLTKEW